MKEVRFIDKLVNKWNCQAIKYKQQQIRQQQQQEITINKKYQKVINLNLNYTTPLPNNKNPPSYSYFPTHPPLTTIPCQITIHPIPMPPSTFNPRPSKNNHNTQQQHQQQYPNKTNEQREQAQEQQEEERNDFMDGSRDMGGDGGDNLKVDDGKGEKEEAEGKGEEIMDGGEEQQLADGGMHQGQRMGSLKQHQNNLHQHQQEHQHWAQYQHQKQPHSQEPLPTPMLKPTPTEETLHQLQSLLAHLQQQLSLTQHNPHPTSSSSSLLQQITLTQTRLHLLPRLATNKDVTSLPRINHLSLIFKHYCTHIFKTGKHMTFDRLEYEKVHLTIDRLCVFLKDFGLTVGKMGEGKGKEVLEKQEIIRLFKKVSSNCRDLDFEAFILIIEKIAEVYFDAMVNYQQKKLNQRNERLKIKENIDKKEKLKQHLMKKHQEKIQKLENDSEKQSDPIQQQQDQEKKQAISGQNDDLIEKLMNEEDEQAQELTNPKDESLITPNPKQQPSKNPTQPPPPSSHNPTTPSKATPHPSPNLQPSSNPLLLLTRQQKIEYFYEMIDVDDVQSFTNKMRELNLPLFKVYFSQQNVAKNAPDPKGMNKGEQRRDEYLDAGNKMMADNDDDDKRRLKQLREKLTQRNQKLKHTSVPSLTREQYELRKLKRSRIQQDQQQHSSPNTKKDRKQKKIDLTQTQINLSSLSKLAYDNVNFTKFNPKSLFSKDDQDDEIFLKEYGDSPIRQRKPPAAKGITDLTKNLQHTKRMIDQKDKNSETFLLKLKQRQSEVEINQKKEEVSQMYRFNDRTQRQKRLIDRFLEKNGK